MIETVYRISGHVSRYTGAIWLGTDETTGNEWSSWSSWEIILPSSDVGWGEIREVAAKVAVNLEEHWNDVGAIEQCRIAAGIALYVDHQVLLHTSQVSL